jgi:hypothetical protein
MNFVFGSFLWLLPLAAVPIIIHLLQRQRYVQVKFAATDFLRKAIQRVRRRVLLQDLLLLVLRTLAVVLVVLALARPSAHSQLLDASRAPQLEIVIIDASMSMQQFVGDSNAFSAAQDIAKNIFSNLDDNRDRAALIIASRRAQSLSQGSSRQALMPLTAKSLACGNANANWLDAVHLVEEAISELALENSEVHLTIISDFQDNEWFSGGEAATAMTLFSDRKVNINYQTVGAGQTANVAVHNSNVTPQTVVKGGEVVFSCEVRNYTSLPQQRLLQLFLDGKVIAEEEFEIKARSSESFEQMFSLNEVGSRKVEVTLTADGLHADDQQSVGLEVVAEWTTILCSNNSDFGNADVSSNFLSYLNLGDQAPLRPIVLGPHQLSSSALNEAQLLILSDLGSLPSGKIKLIESFVAAGGGLLVVVGPQSTTPALQPLMLQLGLKQFEIAGARQRDALLTINDAEHPALKLFSDPQWQALLTEVPHRTFQQFDVEGEHRLVLSFSATESDYKSAALIQFNHNKGKVAVSAAAPYARWNRMPEVPGGTMALIYDLLFSLVPQPELPSKLKVAERLDLANTAAITSPTGKSLPYSSQLTLSKLGAYTIDGHSIGVHALESESDLRSIDVSNLPLSSDAHADAVATTQQQSNSPLAETLLYVLLACLVCESLLSFSIDRRRTA